MKNISEDVVIDSTVSKKHTMWLVDMENVVSRWEYIVPRCETGDTIIFFITNKVGAVKLHAFADAHAKGIDFRFLECQNGLPNALDFQLVTELGRLSILEPDTSFVIVSADHGFRSVIEFMRNRGVTVKCFSPKEPSKESLPEEEVPAELPDGIVMPLELIPAVRDQHDDVWHHYSKRIRTTYVPEQEADAITDVCYAAMSVDQNKRKVSCLNGLRTKYGDVTGRKYYTEIKGIVHDVAVNGPLPGSGWKDPDTFMPSDLGQSLLGYPLGEPIFAVPEYVPMPELLPEPALESELSTQSSPPQPTAASPPKKAKTTKNPNDPVPSSSFKQQLNKTLSKAGVPLSTGYVPKIAVAIMKAKKRKDKIKYLSDQLHEIYNDAHWEGKALKAVFNYL